MVGTMARGAQSMKSKFLKTMQQKGYHRESSSSEMKGGAAVGPKGEEWKKECQVDGYDGTWWVPHHRTGIYYPKGHEKVMEDVPTGAAKSMKTHWFDVPDSLFTNN